MQITKRDDVVKTAKTANRVKKTSNTCKFCKNKVNSVMVMGPTGKKKSTRKCCLPA